MNRIISLLSAVFVIISLIMIPGKSQAVQGKPNLKLKKITAPDGDSGDRFGESVAVSASGKYMAVGAPNYDDPVKGADSGAVYLYRKDVSWGEWTLEKKFQPASPGSTSYRGFGISVAVADDLLVVGELDIPYFRTVKNLCNWKEVTGRVYAFRRNSTGFSSPEVFEAAIGPFRNDPGYSISSSLYGISVDVSKDGLTFAVGSPREKMKFPHPEQDGGPYEMIDSFYCYRYDKLSSDLYGIKWSPLIGETPSDSSGRSLFGASIALSPDGSILAVGSPAGWGRCHTFEISSHNYGSGFNLNINVNPTFNPHLTAPDGTSLYTNDLYEELGTAVDICDGRHIAISSPEFFGKGRAYRYDGAPGNPATKKWNTPAQFTIQTGGIPPINYTNFGSSIATSQGYGINYCDLLVVGCRDYGKMKHNSPGAAFVYCRTGMYWDQGTLLTLTGAGPDDEFGYSVALAQDGSALAIGDPSDHGKKVYTGAVYVAAPLPLAAPTPPGIEINYWHFENIRAFVCPLLFNPWDPDPLPYQVFDRLANFSGEMDTRLNAIEELYLEADHLNAAIQEEELKEEGAHLLLDLFQEEAARPENETKIENFQEAAAILRMEMDARVMDRHGNRAAEMAEGIVPDAE